MTDRDKLKELARGIVLAQGNVFIKEMLRRKDITIGATKADFERNMLDAIDRDELTLADIDEWLAEVEGWGNQHVYLFNVPAALANDGMWGSGRSVRARVNRAGLGDLWSASTSFEFPADPTLTSVSFGGNRFRMVWQEGAESWVRVPDRDYQEAIDGDLYEFRAFRRQADRIVTRFELDLEERLAGIFTSLPVNNEDHAGAVAAVEQTVDRVFDFERLRPVVISRVLKKLDQASVEGGGRAANVGATSQATRLTSGGSYVEFAARSRDASFLDSDAVRNVRLAIRGPQLEQFTGTRGTFLFTRTGPTGSSDRLRVQLFGNEKRIRFWAQMTAEEVWTILRALRTFE